MASSHRLGVLTYLVVWSFSFSSFFPNIFSLVLCVKVIMAVLSLSLVVVRKSPTSRRVKVEGRLFALTQTKHFASISIYRAVLSNWL